MTKKSANVNNPKEDIFIDIGVKVNVTKLLVTRLSIVADSGAGKSQTARKFIESIDGKVQQIIIDPEGEYYTLREKYNFCLVGNKGEIPISVTYAETIAKVLMETGMSAIIDLSELPRKERIMFVKKFAEGLINIEESMWHEVFVYLDEAQLFAPEGGKEESSDAVAELAFLGRKRGICLIPLTQRMALLSKHVLAGCANKLIGRTALDIDRKRAKAALGFINKEDDQALQKLADGEFYAFGPAMSTVVKKIKIGQVVTMHPRPGRRTLAVPPTPAAIGKLLAHISSIPEEAKKELDTKKKLQDEVARLTRLLKQVTPGPGKGQKKSDSSPAPDLKEKNAKIIELQGVIKKLEKQNQTNKKEFEKWRGEALDNLSKAQLLITKTPLSYAEVTFPQVELPGSSPALGYGSTAQSAGRGLRTNRVIESTYSSGSDKGGDLSKGERRVLTACAQYPGGLSRPQFPALTGYTRSTTNTYLKGLFQKGMVIQDGGRIVATQEGVKVLGPGFEPLPTGKALQAFWLQNLPLGEGKILQLCINAYPKSLTRDQISEESGYTRSSTNTYLKMLVRKEIIVIIERSNVKCSEDLFD